MITGLMFRDGIISASNNINSNREAVDALNIFPVPDGDTGTNMSMTISAAAKEVEQMPDDSTIADVSKKMCLGFAQRCKRKLGRYSVSYFQRLFQSIQRIGFR